jgi:hypothetical protein
MLSLGALPPRPARVVGDDCLGRVAPVRVVRALAVPGPRRDLRCCGLEGPDPVVVEFTK